MWFYGFRKKKVGPVILIALLAHHTPTVTSCNGMSRINMGNLLYWEFTCLLTWDQVSSTTQNECGIFYCIMHTMKLSVHKIQFTLWPVLQSLWTTVDAAHTHIFCMFSYCLEWNHFLRSFSCICQLLSIFAWHFLWQLYSANVWFEMHVPTTRLLIHCTIISMEFNVCV